MQMSMGRILHRVISGVTTHAPEHMFSDTMANIESNLDLACIIRDVSHSNDGSIQSLFTEDLVGT